MEKSMRTILIGHRTQWSLFSSSSSIVAIVSIFSKYWYLFIKHSTHQRFKQLPTYKTLESKLHYGKKNAVFVTSSMLLFFFFSSVHLFLLLSPCISCDAIGQRSFWKSQLMLKIHGQLHLFVIGNNKNGKVFVAWNISHGRPIIFHKMKKKKMHVQLNELNEK